MPFEKESVFEIDATTDRVFRIKPTSRRPCERFRRHSPYARAHRLRHLRDFDETVLRGPREAIHIHEAPVHAAEQAEGAVDDRVIEFVAENLDIGNGLAEGWFEFLVVCLALIYDMRFGPAL